MSVVFPFLLGCLVVFMALVAKKQLQDVRPLIPQDLFVVAGFVVTAMLFCTSMILDQL